MLLFAGKKYYDLEFYILDLMQMEERKRWRTVHPQFFNYDYLVNSKGKVPYIVFSTGKCVNLENLSTFINSFYMYWIHGTWLTNESDRVDILNDKTCQEGYPLNTDKYLRTAMPRNLIVELFDLGFMDCFEQTNLFIEFLNVLEAIKVKIKPYKVEQLVDHIELEVRIRNSVIFQRKGLGYGEKIENSKVEDLLKALEINDHEAVQVLLGYIKTATQL